MATRETRTIADLSDQLKNVPRKSTTLLVGIDGCGGSGKSTFARALGAWAAASVVHMDDFYLPTSERQSGNSASEPIGANFDWQRLRREVLLPLSNDDAATYQRYDWPSDAMKEWIHVAPGGIVVIEGVGCTRGELREFYDYRIFVDCPRDLRIARGVARDGEAARERWENDWCPAEELYIQAHAPREFADLVVDGRGCAEIDAEQEFVAVCRR